MPPSHVATRPGGSKIALSDVHTEPEGTKYSLKIVNPQKKRDYKVVKIGRKVCKDINELISLKQ